MSSFSGESQRAAERIIHASGHRGLAPGRARLSYRQIAQSLGISASTLQGDVQRAPEPGLSWLLPDDLYAVALDEWLFNRDVHRSPGRPEPDWLEVHRERTRGEHVTLQVLWLEYR